MTRKERENVLNHINEKQLWINRLEKSLERRYKEIPANEGKIAYLEDRQYAASLERNGMVWAMRCAGVEIKQRIDPENPGCGLWYIV